MVKIRIIKRVKSGQFSHNRAKKRGTSLCQTTLVSIFLVSVIVI